MALEGVHPGTKETALQKLLQLPQDAQVGAIAEAVYIVENGAAWSFMEPRNLMRSTETG
jgi:hypothetical protein